MESNLSNNNLVIIVIIISVIVYTIKTKYDVLKPTYLNVFLKLSTIAYLLKLSGYSTKKSLMFGVGILLIIDYLFRNNELFQNEQITTVPVECNPNDPPQTLTQDPMNLTKATFNIIIPYINDDGGCRSVVKNTPVDLIQGNYLEKSLSQSESDLIIDTQLMLLSTNTNKYVKVNLIIKAGYKVTLVSKNNSVVFASTDVMNGIFVDSSQLLLALIDIQNINVSPL